MTTLTMRYIKGDFVVTGPDVPPMQFKSRPEARDSRCKTSLSRLARLNGMRRGGRLGSTRKANEPT